MHNHERFRFTREMILISLVMLMMAGYFWTQSRYPALNQKAMMGTSVEVSAIGFNTLVEVSSEDSTVRRIFANTLNWMYTNKQGMTFGVLFAAALMSFLSLIRRRSFKGRLPNTILGMLIGTPLGVCVNCAAPIGQGLYAGGTRAETTLAVMISSPTLNIIVITMLFAMFPLHLAILKLALTIGFILIAIPLLTRIFEPRKALPVGAGSGWSKILADTPINADADNLRTRTWPQALVWLFNSYSANLWFIILRTVPLMILAGFLGSAFITLVPFESLQSLLPHEGRTISLLMMGLLAVIGVFLPVPMTFDVIIVAILIQAGFPVDYAMVLLFTLGIFSIYSYSIVWHAMGPKLATGMLALVALTGMVAGVAAYRLDLWHTERQEQVLHNWMQRQLADTLLEDMDHTAALAGTPMAELAPGLAAASLRPEALATRGELRVEQIAFSTGGLLPDAGQTGGPLFIRADARDLGIDAIDDFSLLDILDHRLHFRGIASGDVHNDGWVDLLVTGEPGIYLYANNAGKGFTRQAVAVPVLAEVPVMSVAMVDLNNDGWLDIYVSTYNGGNHVIYNDQGDFTAARQQRLPNQPKALSSPATAFGDLDQDGDLDIVLGNWSLGRFTGNRSYGSSRDVWLENRMDTEDGAFIPHPLEGSGGETLSTLISDFNHDGHPDLMVGNDYTPPDMLYLGDGQGELRLMGGSEGLLPYSTHFTMSIDSGDVDNDLIPELFVVQIAPTSQSGVDNEEICAEHTNAQEQDTCLATRTVLQRIVQSKVKRDATYCEAFDNETERDGCLALFQLWRATKWDRERQHCEVFGPTWAEFGFACWESFDLASTSLVATERDDIVSIMDKNIFLVRNPDGRYQDRAAEFGLDQGGWSWNAKFADLDSDGWQDIYLVNGYPMDESDHFGPGLRAPNTLYRNREGHGFDDASTAFGLHSYLDSVAFSYADLDNDGDLDIVNVPMFGPLWVYENQGAGYQSLAVELRDERGNRFGIGARIIIDLPDASRQMRELKASGGYLSFDAPIAHFGLGEQAMAERIEVVWADGSSSHVDGPFAAGKRYILTRLEKSPEQDLSY